MDHAEVEIELVLCRLAPVEEDRAGPVQLVPELAERSEDFLEEGLVREGLERVECRNGFGLCPP